MDKQFTVRVTHIFSVDAENAEHAEEVFSDGVLLDRTVEVVQAYQPQ